MKLLPIILVAFFLHVCASHHENMTGASNFEIEGIPAEAMSRLHEALKNAGTPELRKTAIANWENTLPSDQQTIAKTFFAKMEQQHATDPTRPAP